MSDENNGTTPPPPVQPAAPQPVTESDEKTWAMIAHFGQIVVGFIAPLVAWLIYKDRSAYLDSQGKEALNFSILFVIIYVVLNILGVITLGLGYFLLPVVWIVQIVFNIMGGMAASRHEDYRYPFNWRIIK